MARTAPFVFLFVPFSAGIWLASQFSIPWWASLLAAMLGLGCLIALRNLPDQAWLAACALFLAGGALRQTLVMADAASAAVAAYNGRSVTIEGVVVDEPDWRPTYAGLRVRAYRLVTGPEDARVSSLVLVRADRSTPWQYGDQVRAFGVIDAPPVMVEFDYREYLARKGIHSWMSRPDRVQRLSGGHGEGWYGALLGLRAVLRLATQRVMPSPESALLNGILIGDDNEIPERIVQAFRRTGASHIVSISGFNVSIVVAMVVPALSRLLNKRSAALVAIPAIVVYTLLVGASASVVRAATMAVVALFGQVFWRRGFTLNTLCAAGLAMLLADPATLFDGGFQLSFAATLGLVLYADRITFGVQHWLERRWERERAQKLTGVLADVLLVTLAAQITTLPLILTNFRQLSLVSLLTNALVLPLQPAVMTLGMAASASGILSPAAGAVVALPAYALLTATLRIVEWTGSFSWAAVPVYAFGEAAAVAYYALLFGVTAVATQSPRTRRDLGSYVRQYLKPGLILLAAVIAATIGFVLWLQRPDGKLHVTFAGPGVFVQTPSGKQMVFAGGGGVLPAMGRAMPLADRAIELVMLPQRDDRARSDTLPILQRYRVGTLIVPAGEDEPTPMQEEWTAQAKAQSARIIAPPVGTRVVLEPGVVLTVEERMLGGIGAQLSYGEVVFELVGDALPIGHTLREGSVVFVGVRGGQPDVLDAARPRWVVWADAGGAPPKLDASIRAIALRDVGAVEFVSDGRGLAVTGLQR